MTLDDFRDWLTEIDPQAKHYESEERGNYTVWAEYGRVLEYADGRNGGGWKVQVERYTKEEHDQLAKEILTAIDQSDVIACEYMVDYDRDSGYIRHLYDCEVS